jgi:hypothetical protein
MHIGIFEIEKFMEYIRDISFEIWKWKYYNDEMIMIVA